MHLREARIQHPPLTPVPMKISKFFTPLLLVLLLSSCIFEGSGTERAYTPAELLGKWNQIEDMQNAERPKIESLQFVNDSVVEVTLIEKGGKRKVTGTWATKYSKKLLPGVSFESDVRISFMSSHKNSHLLLLMLQEKKDKLLMTTMSYTFQKEKPLTN